MMAVFWWAMMIFVAAGVVINHPIFKALAVVAALCVLVIYAIQCVRSWSAKEDE